MRSQLRMVWLAVLGENSQQGVKLPPRMHLVRQILGHTVWVERAIAIACLLLLALCEGNAVRVFLLPVFKKQTAEQLGGCMPVPTQLHMYKLRQLFHHVSSAEREHCMLPWPQRYKAVFLHNH